MRMIADLQTFTMMRHRCQHLLLHGVLFYIADYIPIFVEINKKFCYSVYTPHKGTTCP